GIIGLDDQACTGDVPARPIEPCHEPHCDRVVNGFEHNGDHCCRRLGGQCRRGAARNDQGHVTPDQIGSEHWQAIEPLVRKAEQDFDISPFRIPAFIEAAPQAGHPRRITVRSSGAEIADHWYCRLLRERRERPNRRATKARDELPPSHSITSSAWPSSVSGTVSPSAFAVLRLITISNLVGIWTGSSLGFAPRRIRFT